MRKIKDIIITFVKGTLDAVYIPYMYLGFYAVRVRAFVTGENAVQLYDELLVPKLIKFSCFIGRVCDKIDGHSNHEQEVLDSWSKNYNLKED